MAFREYLIIFRAKEIMKSISGAHFAIHFRIIIVPHFQD